MDRKLKKLIEQEKELYIPHVKTLKQRFLVWFEHDEAYLLFCFMRELRTIEYYTGKNRLRCIWHGRKLGKLSERLGGIMCHQGV